MFSLAGLFDHANQFLFHRQVAQNSVNKARNHFPSNHAPRGMDESACRLVRVAEQTLAQRASSTNGRAYRPTCASHCA